MGRLGAGEALTLFFGLGLPLAHLTVGAVLVLLGRRAMRAGRRFGAGAFFAATSALLAMLLGLLGTAIELARVFGSVADAEVAARANRLAEGIAGAMIGVTLGVVVSLALYAVSGVLLVLARRAPP
jgi:biopolymer transport protein ExbB/TolQ